METFKVVSSSKRGKAAAQERLATALGDGLMVRPAAGTFHYRPLYRERRRGGKMVGGKPEQLWGRAGFGKLSVFDLSGRGSVKRRFQSHPPLGQPCT